MGTQISVRIPDDFLAVYRLLARTRALNEVIIIDDGKEIPGVRITGLGQEITSVVPLYVLLKMGILENSIKSCDHRTVYGTAVVVDELTEDPKENVVLDFLRNYFVRATGGNRGRDGNVHWVKMDRRILGLMCSDMGRTPGIAVGCSEEIRRLEWPGLAAEKRPISITFFGDGAAQQGGVHEAMNWTAASNCVLTPEELARVNEQFLDCVTKETGVLRGAPMIFVINDNRISLFADAIDEHGRSDLAKRANGYGNMVGVDVDGTDPIALFTETEKAVRRAQNLQSTLIVANCYRLTGHNEVQIKRAEGSVERGDFFDVEAIAGHDKEGLKRFREAVKKEPVHHGWSNWLIQAGHATREELDAIVATERKYARALVEKVLAEPKITVEEDEKDRSVFPPIDWLQFACEGPVGHNSQTEMRKYGSAYTWIVSKLMGEDPRGTYSGQDVAQGGVLNLTPGLLEEFGQRIFNTPISEEAIVANAAGRALVGGKPICEFQFAPFWLDAAPLFAHAVAPQWYQKRMKYGCISIFPSGIVHGGGSGHFHEAWPERFLYGMSGIAIVAPSNAYDLVGLMRAAREFPGPVAVLLQIAASGMPEFTSDVPLEPYVIPIGKAKVVREGTDFTVVTYGAACVAAARNEADTLKKEDGISLEVIDLRTVHPTDFPAIINSVQKTGRCAIFHEDYHSNGSFGEALLGRLSRNPLFAHALYCHAEVIGAKYPFIPTDLDLVWDRLPYKRVGKGVNIKHQSPELAAVIKAAMEYR